MHCYRKFVRFFVCYTVFGRYSPSEATSLTAKKEYVVLVGLEFKSTIETNKRYMKKANKKNEH